MAAPPAGPMVTVDPGAGDVVGASAGTPVAAVKLPKGGKGAPPGHKGPLPHSGDVRWKSVGDVCGVVGNYTPPVQMGGSQVRIYANTDGMTDGNLYLRVGSWSAVGSAAMVMDVADPRDSYIRTSGITQGESGMYYGVFYTGDGYPTQGGYSPSWASSPDGYTWSWWGPIGIFGRNQSSAANLVVDETRADGYRFMAWLDLPGPVPGLYLMHADTGLGDWTSDRVNVWPIAGEQPQYVTGAKTPYGYHLIGADAYPAKALRHIFSCTGMAGTWKVLELASPVIDRKVGKGTNLVWDHATGTLHALTSGAHWTLQEQDWGC
jgi:hypothetical protein